MAETEFRAIALVGAAFNDLERVRERGQLVYILAGILLLGAVLPWATTLIPLNALASAIAVFLGQVVVAYLAAPVYVALHRFAASAGQDNRPLPNHKEPAPRKFWAWSVVLLLLINISPVVSAFTGGPSATQDTYDLASFAPFFFVIFIVLIVGFIISIRLMPLLPMAALDPDQSSISRALRLSKGRFWTIFGAMFLFGLAGLIPGVVILVVAGLLATLVHPFVSAGVVIFLSYIVNVLLSVAAVFLATHIYMGLLERLQIGTGSTT